ncbi:MAG: methionine--tRNA ligase [Candidatus Paceibacterota bacterium]
MAEKEARYITTTLPYVNDEPHIGHALEFIQADALARYWRHMGHEVFFNTGTDEHGQKIAQKAAESGQDVNEYVDHFAKRFEELNREVFGLSFDAFIRTTDPQHMEAAQEMWRRCDAAGDIYKKEYSGLYCVGCEVYYKESELDENKCCLIHKKPVEEVIEENYFFKLSNYQAYLEEYLSRPGVIQPEWRREEALAFVKGGLEDFSISRDVSRMSWGIPVPNDESQVMYVWFDALTNYISTLGWPTDADGNFEKFWNSGVTLQVAGKDQVRFQSIIWQAMLKSAGVKATDTVFYHGFINSGGHKMSKSLGNVISPFEVVDKYGREAARYILLRHVHSVEDSDVTWEKMDEWYTANLVNGLGNLTARIMKMAEDNLEVPIEKPAVGQFPKEYIDALDQYDFQAAADIVWQKVGALDERITSEQPFKLVKSDPEKGKEIIRELVVELYLVARLLYPFMPATNERIKEAVLMNTKPDTLFPRLV